MVHHKLRRLRVYGGFLDKLDIRFADGLNCIIGGRGSGKTTVLEFIRHALDRAPRSGTSAAKAAEDRLKTLLAANLGTSGYVELEFESQEGLVYQIRRGAHDAPQVTDAAGKPVRPEVLGSSVLVDAAIFSHNQIEDIAQSPVAQRELIDRLCGQQSHAIETQLAQNTSRLRENAQRIIALHTRLQAAQRDLIDLSSWESKLAAANAALGEGGLADGLQAAAEHKALREQEKAALDRVRAALSKLRGLIGDTVLPQVKALAAALPESLLKSPNGHVLADLSREIGRKIIEIDLYVSSPLDKLALLERSVDDATAALAAVHAPQEARYAELAAVAAKSGARLAARDEAAREVMRLSAGKGVLGELQAELDQAQRARGELRDELQRLRGDRHARRSAAAGNVSAHLGGKVRIILAAAADVVAYREFLVAVMRRSGKQYNAPIERLVAQVTPVQLGQFVDRDDHAALAATAEINPEFADSLLKALREAPDKRFELDVLELEDVPRIELQVQGDWRSSDKLSTGQKSAAILPILLMDSEAPLLVDQPEDNLDNSFITDAIIPQLAASRGRRQLVFITHNPNLPVLGEAAQVIVLEADGRNARQVAQGPVEAVKQHILRLMEGGREAFRHRQQRYEVAP
ncbi:AAA family ATPase [Nannocystis sp. ILAH1]|uniref:AAA family ATPase n=1 Tax=Nannocystis sp. ILAH1 TaxID=2996789 RepID=UPI0022709F29|nr:AAA family ATPase [Nannocystis sp. ILAH1]